VNVSYRQDTDASSVNFGGPVERLQFTARGSDIVCRSIAVTTQNGRKFTVFRGTLRQGSPNSVDLPGTSQDVQKVHTNCHSDRRGGATIDVAADIGRYRSNWQRSPDWSRTWARMFNWGSNASASVGNAWDRNTSFTVTIATLRFSGDADSDRSSGGWAGRSLNSIALRANDNDAQCRRFQVTLDNNATRDLNLRDGYLRRGQTVTYDLPGVQDRTVKSLMLRCRPAHGAAVTVDVLGNK